MPHPRLGTPAGNRAVSSVQRGYDNMTPDEEGPPVCPMCGKDTHFDGADWRCECDSLQEIEREPEANQDNENV